LPRREIIAMQLFIRRFLVVAALMFWQGGFIFYASVVVPIGQQVLASPKDQGFITRHVTRSMNLSGAIALLPLGWDCAACGDPKTLRRRLRWLAWVVMFVTLGVLFWLHPMLDAYLDPETFGIHHRSEFRFLHRCYLWASTVQWAFAVLYVILTLPAWRAEDRSPLSLP
jgi:hypothetical protein